MKNATRSGFIGALAAALQAGDITKQEAQQLRAQLGVSKSYFTKKQVDKDKQKRKAKIAEASRRRNRGLGKGEKRTGGIR